MFIFVVMLLLAALYKAKVQFGKGFYHDYASIEQTRSINGIFTVLILLSHTFAKVSENGVFDAMYTPVRTFLGQFVVVPFLFYSGYGIMSSLASKKDYLKKFPRDRLLTLVIRFALITVVYIVLHWILGNKYSPWHILASFVGITSIGNGGWYIFSTFAFYISVIICFNLFRKNQAVAAIGVMLCLILLTVTEIILDFPSYYYSTTIFFGVGMFYALVKKYFDGLVMKNNLMWCMVFLTGVIGFVYLKKWVGISVLFYPAWCGFGMLAILCASMKIKLENKLLKWVGKTTFFCFTLQGIPQTVFAGLINNNYVLYVLVIICSIVLTAIANLAFTKWERFIYERRNSHVAFQ